MRTHTKLFAATVLVAATCWLAGCNSDIDDEPNVVLEVDTLTISPINGSIDPITLQCVFQIQNATANFKNKPKNALAGQEPFNDIVMQDVIVGYTWDDALGVTSAQFGVGGTVPANGSSTGQFAVVNAQDLIIPSREGHTASITLTFRGVTVAGEAVQTTTGGTITVNSCQ